MPHWRPSSAAPGHLPGSPPQLHVLLGPPSPLPSALHQSPLPPPHLHPPHSPPHPATGGIGLGNRFLRGIKLVVCSPTHLEVCHWVLRVENSLQDLLISRPFVGCHHRWVYFYFYAVIIENSWAKGNLSPKNLPRPSLFRCKGIRVHSAISDRKLHVNIPSQSFLQVWNLWVSSSTAPPDQVKHHDCLQQTELKPCYKRLDCHYLMITLPDVQSSYSAINRFGCNSQWLFMQVQEVQRDGSTLFQCLWKITPVFDFQATWFCLVLHQTLNY